jgi:hypothetical protein
MRNLNMGVKPKKYTLQEKSYQHLAISAYRSFAESGRKGREGINRHAFYVL